MDNHVPECRYSPIVPQRIKILSWFSVVLVPPVVLHSHSILYFVNSRATVCQSSWLIQSLRVPSSKYLVHFRSFHRICPGPRLCLTTCNTLDFYDENVRAPHWTPKLDDHPFSAVQYIRNYTYAKFMFPESLLFTCRILFGRRCNPCYIFSLFHLFTWHIWYSVDEKGVACATNRRVRKLKQDLNR
jgi:hypothetical protein